MNIKVEAGAGDIGDPIIYGRLIKLTAREAVILWEHQAWYTCGHIGLEYGPLRRTYTRQEYDKLLNSHNYDEIRISPPPRKIRRCPTCKREL